MTVLEELAVAQAGTATQAATAAPCDMRLRVQLASDVPDPRDGKVISALLGNHSAYELIRQRPEPETSSVVAVSLRGPGPATVCREVVESIRLNPRVVSIEVQQDAAGVAPSASAEPALRGVQPAGAAQPVGTVHAGPDGDWILDPRFGVPYAQQAKDRYECDIWAVDQSGFDPTKDDGGVSPAVPGKRADYLRAEAHCFQTRGYVMR
jgi:hypothetical protein